MIAYRRAIDYRHLELSPRAAVNLGYMLFNDLAQVEEVEAAFHVAIDSSDAEQAQLARQNLAAMRQLTAARRRGDRHDIVEDAKDLLVGYGSVGSFHTTILNDIVSAERSIAAICTYAHRPSVVRTHIFCPMTVCAFVKNLLRTVCASQS